MDELFKLMKAFEKRNNISTYVEFCSDGSCSLHEFWNEELLSECDDIEALKLFLTNTHYQLDQNGLCYSPVKIKK